MNTKTTKDFLIDNFKIDKNVIDFVKECEDELKDQFEELDEITEYNQLKVLNAFQKNRISDNHFNWNTGYGYDDIGRDARKSLCRYLSYRKRSCQNANG